MIELTLPKMTCGHCVRTVTKAVQNVDTTARLHVHLPEHVVQIDSKRPAEEFRAALTEQGFAPA
jgi:copper chaperone